MLGYKPITSPVEEPTPTPEASSPTLSGLGYKPIEQKSLFDQTIDVGKGIYQTGKNIVQTLATPSGLADVGQTFVEGGIPSLKNVMYNYSDMFYKGFGSAWKALGADTFADYAAKNKEDARARAKTASDEVKSFMTERRGDDTRGFLERLSSPSGEKDVAEIVGTQLPTFLAIIGSGLLSRGASLPTAPAILATSFAMNSGDAYQQGKDYLEKTGQELTPEWESKLSRSATMVGVTTAPLDLFGAERILGSIGMQTVKGQFFKNAMRTIVDTGANTLAEGGTEGLQEVIQNAWAKTFDENQSLWDGALEAAFGGGLFGGGASITIHSAGLLRSGIMGRLKAGDTPEAVGDKIEATAKDNNVPIDRAQIDEVVSEVEQGYNGIIDTEVKAPLEAGSTPTEVALKLADKLGTDQAKAIADRVAAQLQAPAPVETATETSAKAFADIEKKVDENILAQTPQDFMEQFNSFQEKADADSKALRDQVAELEKKVTEATPRSQEKKDAKIALEAERKKLREVDDAAQNKIYEHAISLRDFLSGYIKDTLGLNVDDTEMGNVVDDVNMLITDGNFGANVWKTPISEIVQQVVNDYKGAQQPSEAVPTEKDATRKRLVDGVIAPIGLSKMTEKELQDERIRLVNKSLSNDLTSEEQLRLKMVLANIDAQKPKKEEPKPKTKKSTGVQVGDVIDTGAAENSNRTVTRIEKRSVFFKDDTGQEYSAFSLPTLNTLLKEGAWKLVEAKTQKEQVKEVLAKKGTASVKEVAKETGILEPNIRRILGVGAKEGAFERIADGVYRLTVGDQEIAVVIPADAREALPQLVKDGFKADMVFLDIPYDLAGNKGGNRMNKAKGTLYETISVEEFGDVVDNVSKILRDDSKPVVYMISQSETSKKRAELYTKKLLDAGFIPLARGNYYKMSKKGTRLTMPMRSTALPPEGIIILNKTGEIDTSTFKDLEFKLVRPKGYQTEKPAELLHSLITMTTKEGDVVFDPFAGSGVTGEQAIKAGRKTVLIEKSAEAVKEHIIPRLEKAKEETVPSNPLATVAGSIVYHATSKAGAEQISKNGLNVSEAEKQRFGKGIYLALSQENAEDFVSERRSFTGSQEKTVEVVSVRVDEKAKIYNATPEDVEHFKEEISENKSFDLQGFVSEKGEYDGVLVPQFQTIDEEGFDFGNPKDELVIFNSAVVSIVSTNPLATKDKTFYHGTLQDFADFDLTHAGKNTEWENAKFGFFFIDDEARAKQFVEDTRQAGDARPAQVKQVRLDIKNPIDFTYKGIFTKAEQAPVIVEITGGKARKTPELALKYINDNVGLGEIADLMGALYEDIKNKDIMQKAGFDGIVSSFGQDDTGGDILEYVAFNSNQITVLDKEGKVQNDKGNEDPDNSGSGDNAGGVPQPVPDSGNKPGGAGETVASKRGGQQQGSPAKRGGTSGERSGARLTNEEVEKIVSSVAVISKDSHREIKLVGEITDEVLEAANQYTPGGESKTGRGILDEYYTASQVVDMVKSLLDLPATKLKVLEPSVGTGNFLYALPETAEHTIAALEVNETTAKIAKIFHPTSRVFASPFENVFMDERGKTREFSKDFDLVIGNPPYGEHRGRYLGLGEEKGITRYEDYFTKRGVDVLKEGGHLAMVLPYGFLDRAKNSAKMSIVRNAELVRAFRLPVGVFSGTEVGTDIVVFHKTGNATIGDQLTRLATISNGQYFKDNPSNILGTVKERKNRFGKMEQFVEGTLDEAITRFYAENDRPEAIALLKGAKIPATEENIASAEATIEESGEKAAKLMEADKQEAGKKTIERKIVQKVVSKPGETVALQSRFKVEHSEAEIAIWKKTRPDGSVQSPTPAEQKTLNLDGGKYYNDFNYQQGDIYEKLDRLEAERGTLGEEQYKVQKAKLAEALPTQESIDDIKISPNVGFVKELSLDTGLLERPVEKVVEKKGVDTRESMDKLLGNEDNNTLRNLFIKWLNDLPNNTFGDSSRWEVKGYVKDEQVRGSDKDRNELIRVRRKIMADSLFGKFLREELSAEQKQMVETAYNKTFNFFHTPDYSKVPMFSDVYGTFKGAPFVLREAQQAGIGRIVNSGVGILAHEVGFGKTISGVMAAHEIMARGWAKKPLFVVPGDSHASQWADTIRELVPDAKINILGNLGVGFKGDLSSLSIPDGSFSLITFEGFKRLAFKDDTYNKLASEFQYIGDELETHRKTEREQEKHRTQKEGIEGKMKKGTRADLFFEELGFDYMTFDEVQNANHIVSKVKLKEGQSSEFNRFGLRQSDLGMKTWLAAQYVQKQNGGRNISLLSATPFTNHPLEYYSILSLVADLSLHKMGFRNVNDFFGTFMEAEHEYEFKADGTYQKKTDIRRFRNFRQFRKLLDSYIDFRQEASDLSRPNRVQINYEIPKNAVTRDLEAQAQAIFKENEQEKGKGAKTLRAITELRKIAFSPYASKFSPDIAPENYRDLVENSPKLATVMSIIAQNVKDRPDAGQIIYSEVGVEFFPMLKEYMQKILGIKEVEIIRGGTAPKARMDIQERFNAGKVKVLIGSEAIAEGLNLQKNTSDMHLLSLPWNFTALRQVVGRAWRQGNRFGNVRINQYFIQDSVDVFMSQKLDNKQQRYENAMSSNANEIDVGDVSYSEMKFDLIQDPETRAKLEIEAKKEELKAQSVQEGAELAFALRKLEKINDISDDIKNAEEGLKRENAKDVPNDYWVDAHTKALSKAKKELNEEIKKLRDKSIDVDTLLQRKVEGEKKVAEIDAQVKTIEDTLPERIKEIAASLPPRQDFSPAVIQKFVAERAEHNKTFYTVAEAPKAEVARVAQEVKEIKNATGTKVVKTKKTVKLVKEAVKKKREGGTRDERVLKILGSEQPVTEKVDAILEVKQAGKDFKDVGERVAGSRKESAAIRTVIGEGDSKVLAEMIRRLGWDAVSAVLNKQDILADVAKPDPVKDVAEGVSPYLAFLKKQFYDKIGRTMVLQESRSKWRSTRFVYYKDDTDENKWTTHLTDMKSDEAIIAATKAIEEYPTLLRELVEKLTAVKTFSDLNAFDEWFTNDEESGGRFPAEYKVGNITVGLERNVFGAVGGNKMAQFDWFTVYNKDDAKPSFYPTKRNMSRIIVDELEFSHSKKVVKDYLTQFIGKADWVAKATKKVGATEETELTHGNFKPLERIERSAEAIKDEEATAENLQKVYGFKSVQLGNYMDDATAREHIRHTVGAVVDMSNLLRIDFPKLMNAMGLSIAYGARGGGKANAHFEPGNRIINLTKGRGDGSFFHEFIHFLDFTTNSRGNRSTWSSKKDRWYISDTLDQATADLMGAITGKRVRKVVEFKPQDDAYVLQRPENPIMKMYAEGKTLEQALAFALVRTDTIDRNGRQQTYQISPSQTYQEIADVYRQVVSKEAKVYHEDSEYLKGSKKYGSDYWSRPEELLARAGQAYIEDKLAARGMTNNYLTRTTLTDDPESSMAKVYPQGEERKLFNTYFDRVFAELSARYPSTENVERTARFRVIGKEKAEVTMTEAGAYLADVKKRLNLDFDVHFVDALLNGYKIDPFTRVKTPIEAWGATFDNTIVLAKEMAKHTAPHEVVHLTMANMEKIPVFGREGITREKVISAKAAEMGVEIKNDTDEKRVEEALAMDFEKYLDNKYPAKGIIRRFFATLKRLLIRFARAIVTTHNDIVQDYYDIIDEGVETEEAMVRLENAGVIEAFIAETGGEVLDMDTLEGDVPHFKLKEEPDKLLQNRKRKFNELLNKQGQLEEDTLGWKTDLLKQVELKSQIAPEVEATPQNVKELARFTNRRKDPVGELTERGTVEVSKLDFANPQEAQAEIYAYLKRKAELVSTRNRLRDLRRKIAGAKGESRTNKAAMRDVERKLKLRKRLLEQKEYYVDMGLERGKKEQMKMIRRRGRVVGNIQDQFAIGDSRAKAIIGGRKIHMMSEQEFDDFLVEFTNRAEALANKLSAQDEVKGVIMEKQLQKFENLQKALELPTVTKMSEEQARRFADILSTYQFGDVFLPTRQLELIHRTNWGDIKTEREVLTRMKGVMGFGEGELKTLTAPQGILADGVDVPWVRLARIHPFFNWLTGKRIEAKIQEERETHAIEMDINKLAGKARSSRRAKMGIGAKVLEMVIPTDDLVFGYMESKDKIAFAKEKGMTKEEVDFAQYEIAQYYNAYEYLKSEYGMKERQNYMTHSRRTFFEAMKEEKSFMAAFREVISSQKEDAAAFKIVDETGEVLAFEKFFGYALQRSGLIVPSKNVARVSLAYFRLLARKRAMDAFVPEAMIAVQAHKAVVGTTARGLTKDPTLERFVKAYLNDAKGRKIKFITEQGSTSDIAVRAMVAWTAIKYLGFNLASAIGNVFGDFTAIFWELKMTEIARGITRSVISPVQSHAINKEFRYFTGRNPIVELFDAQYALPERLKKSFMVLMGMASFQSNKFFLRAKLTDNEFRTMVLEDQRLVEISRALSRVKPNTFYIKSLAGNTATGNATFQFGSWAVSITNTIISDGNEVLKMLKNKKVKDALTSREAAQLLKFTIMAGVLYFMVASLLAPDEDAEEDYSIWGRTLRSIRNNLNTLVQALQFTTDITNYGLILKEIVLWGTTLQQFLTQERYKQDGVGYSIGDLKAGRSFERVITPSALRQLFPDVKESALEEHVSEGLKTGVFDAEAVAKDISPDWAEMEEESQKRKIDSVNRLYNIRKSHPNDPVVELLLDGDNNKERIEALIEYGKQVGEGEVYDKVKKLYRDPNVCADPKKRTGCLISGQLLKDYQKARKNL